MAQATPRINLDDLRERLSADDFEIVRGIVATQGKNAGRLRASKPKGEDGRTGYVWRNVAFFVSPIAAHQCMPVTCDFDLPGSYGDRLALAKQLDVLVDAVVDTIPRDQWCGVRRWGMALGVVGAPELRANGSIVYR